MDPLCHCGQSESLVHLFVECQLAKRLFAWYQSWVHRAQPSLTCPTPCQILVGITTPYASSLFPCLLGIIRHQIWVARNGFRFDKRPIIYGDILNRVKSSLHFNLHIQLRHCPQATFLSFGWPAMFSGLSWWRTSSSFQRSSGSSFSLCRPVTCCLESTGVALTGSYCHCKPSLYVCKYCSCYVTS